MKKMRNCHECNKRFKVRGDKFIYDMILCKSCYEKELKRRLALSDYGSKLFIDPLTFPSIHD